MRGKGLFVHKPSTRDEQSRRTEHAYAERGGRRELDSHVLPTTMLATFRLAVPIPWVITLKLFDT